MHFKSQHIEARVEHAIATIDITQVFVNELETPVEATYQFPTDPDQNTVVSRVLFEIGDKQVESKVIERVKAQEKYDDAISAGNAAVLVEESEKDKDVLKMTIGGIQPMQEVTVKLTLLKKIEIEAGAYALRIPTSYFIKYGNANKEGPQINTNIAAKEIDAKDSESTYSFNINISTQQPLIYVSIPSHSTVSKLKEDASRKSASITKVNARVSDLKKDICVYFRT